MDHAAAPRTLHHIALAGDWEQAQRIGHYPWSTRGLRIEEAGFLHASFPHQVEPTRERFYADVSDGLVLLTLDTGELARSGFEVRLEPAVPGEPRSELFPHVYGGPLPTSAVREAHELI